MRSSEGRTEGGEFYEQREKSGAMGKQMLEIPGTLAHPFDAFQVQQPHARVHHVLYQRFLGHRGFQAIDRLPMSSSNGVEYLTGLLLARAHAMTPL